MKQIADFSESALVMKTATFVYMPDPKQSANYKMNVKVVRSSDIVNGIDVS